LGAQRQPPDALLAKAATYLRDYETAFSVVVSEERYTQTVYSTFNQTRRGRRVLVSDVVQTRIGAAEWVAFRDVFDVDGAPVRDRDARLQRLFVEGVGDPVTQARSILTESARYNIGAVDRNINVPTMALTYLRESNQWRSTLTTAGREKIEGVNTQIVAFSETATPTVVRAGASDLPARGRFWIDPESGRVVKSEIWIPGPPSSGKITVTYGPVPNLSVWAPLQMKEEYVGWETIRAEATYSNFRQFKVVVADSIK
jgi:hypothetical protein